MAASKDTMAVTADPVSVSDTRRFDDNYHYVQRGGPSNELPSDESSEDPEFERKKALTALTVDEEKKLLHRIDWHLMPLCALLYTIKNLDANSVSNARIMNRGTPQNILTQLDITSDQYGLINALYMIPYILAEVPSNLLFKKMTPSRWQSRIMLTWGIVTTCHTAAKDLGGLYTARFFLGLAEAGMFPGIILHLTYWYRPDEMSVRLLYLYGVGQFSSIFSSLLAYAFDHVSGTGGLSGWQWLFLIEGIVTIVLSVGIWFLLPDFPATARWLSEKEKAFVQARLPPNAPRASEENFNWKQVISSLKDKRLWLFTLNWALFTTGTSGVQFYQPTVIADLGFTDVATAQLLNLPMSIAAIILIALTGVYADKGRLPRPVLPLAVTVVVIACYAVLIVYPNNGGVYATTLIANAFAKAWFPLMWPWRAQTTTRATGSAFSIGFVNSYGQIGDAIGPQIFEDKYAPRYQVSFGVCSGIVAWCGLNMLYTWWITRHTERDTRIIKRVRVAAGKRGQTILEDVVDHDLNASSRA
ncbi:putative pantothenate transporter [Whalleya microplaca]|nr:putative pantothenate transporter [Whalleya microplaca]